MIKAVNSDKVIFGNYVTLRNKTEEKTFHIVGLDEADPALGSISYTSPIAQKLIGKLEGDEIIISNKTYEIIKVSSFI